MVSAVRMVPALVDTMIYAMKSSRLDLPNNASQYAGWADRHLYFHIGFIGFFCLLVSVRARRKIIRDNK